MDDITWIKETLDRIEANITDGFNKYNDQQKEIGIIKTELAVVQTKSGLFALIVSAFVSIVAAITAYLVK
jgi:hypothetical protein